MDAVSKGDSGDAGAAAPAPGGDDATGDKVTQTTAGEPSITSFTTMNFEGKFPTYLAPLMGSKFHIFPKIVVENPSSEPKTVVLRGSLNGYTKQEAVGTIVLQPNEKRSGSFDATLDFSALDGISSPVSAQYSLSLSTQDGKVLYAMTRPVTILSKGTVFWSKFFYIDGKPSDGDLEEVAIAGLLTTPHDGAGQIDALLQKAATFSQYKAMYGYKTCPSSTLDQAKACTADQVGAIYKALQSMGFNYTSVGSDFFAGAQNVRYPADSLRAKTGNCIDGTLVFAAALEAIGMRPSVVYKTGHAFLMVREGAAGTAAGDVGFAVETTMVGNTSKTFVDAINYANQEYADAKKNDKRFHDVLIEDARAAGFTASPFPL